MSVHTHVSEGGVSSCMYTCVYLPMMMCMCEFRSLGSPEGAFAPPEMELETVGYEMPGMGARTGCESPSRAVYALNH